jgi:hypothetical protein
LGLGILRVGYKIARIALEVLSPQRCNLLNSAEDLKSWHVSPRTGTSPPYPIGGRAMIRGQRSRRGHILQQAASKSRLCERSRSWRWHSCTSASTCSSSGWTASASTRNRGLSRPMRCWIWANTTLKRQRRRYFPHGLDRVGPPFRPDGSLPVGLSRAWTLQEKAMAGAKAVFVLYVVHRQA